MTDELTVRTGDGDVIGDTIVVDPDAGAITVIGPGDDNVAETTVPLDRVEGIVPGRPDGGDAMDVPERVTDGGIGREPNLAAGARELWSVRACVRNWAASLLVGLGYRIAPEEYWDELQRREVRRMAATVGDDDGVDCQTCGRDVTDVVTDECPDCGSRILVADGGQVQAQDDCGLCGGVFVLDRDSLQGSSVRFDCSSPDCDAERVVDRDTARRQLGVETMEALQ